MALDYRKYFVWMHGRFIVGTMFVLWRTVFAHKYTATLAHNLLRLCNFCACGRKYGQMPRGRQLVPTTWLILIIINWLWFRISRKNFEKKNSFIEHLIFHMLPGRSRCPSLVWRLDSEHSTPKVDIWRTIWISYHSLLLKSIVFCMRVPQLAAAWLIENDKNIHFLQISQKIVDWKPVLCTDTCEHSSLIRTRTHSNLADPSEKLMKRRLLLAAVRPPPIQRTEQRLNDRWIILPLGIITKCKFFNTKYPI